MENYTLANRITELQPSVTIALNATANALKAKGKDIINLSIGESDFPIPEPIKQKAILAINNNHNKYTPPDGLESLKQAVVKKFYHENKLNFNLDEIIISSGAKQCIFNLAQAILNPGDEVIIPAPYWVSYPEIIKLAGGIPVFINTMIQENFKIIPEQLINKISNKTKLILINSPSNPSGAVYSKEELIAITKILQKYPNIVIASDDIYEHIIWTKEPFVNILNVAPDLQDRTVVINGVSKAYSMTGWRIGYAAGPKAIIAGMKKIQSQVTTCPNVIAQIAATEALNISPDLLKSQANEFKARHDFIMHELKDFEFFECNIAEGSFYLLVKVNAAIEKLNCQTDVELATLLLNKTNVALVAGTAFGAKAYLRISYACKQDLLKTALMRIKNFINSKDTG